jgi:hypothetical protein
MFFAANWWESSGSHCPQLQKFAIRVLSQTCSASGVLLPPYTHLWETWKKSSIHSVCPWGQVRVKVLSPNPQLLRLGQLLAKPRGVVPNKYTKAFTLSTRKLNLGVYCFLQTIDQLTEININIHSPRYIYIVKFTCIKRILKKKLLGASNHLHQHIIKLLK